MKAFSKLSALWVLGLSLYAHAVQPVAVELTLTRAQEEAMVRILSQQNAQLAEKEAISYLTQVVGPEAAGYWGARLTINQVTVEGLKAIHANIQKANLSRDEVMKHVTKGNQTSALVAAYQLTSTSHQGGAIQAPVSAKVNGALPKARAARTDAQLRALVRRTKAAAFGEGADALESYLADLNKGVRNDDPTAVAKATNIGRYVAAVQDKGCSLHESTDGPNCAVLKRGLAGWVKTDRFAHSAASTDFAVDIVRTGLDHHTPSRVQQGHANVMDEAVVQGVGYWDAHSDLDTCYQGAAN